FTMRNLPDDFALIQIDRGNTPPWWFDQRQPLDGDRARHQIAAGTGTAAAGFAGAACVDVIHIRALLIVREREEPRERIGVDVENSGFRIVRAARPVRAVGDVRHSDLAAFTFDDGRSEDGTELDVRYHLLRLGKKLGREVD